MPDPSDESRDERKARDRRFSIVRKKIWGYCQYARLVAYQKCLHERFDESRSYVIASSGRSGSTLLAQLVNSIPRSCVLFEPLHPVLVPESNRAGFGPRKYVRPDSAWPEGEAFLREIFHGNLVNGWMLGQMSLRQAVVARRLIVKFIRANRLLPWLCRKFTLPAPVLLVRHPCAVIASQMKLGWKVEERPEAPEFLNEFPAFQGALAGAEGSEEILAARWALDQLPPLLEPRPHPWIVVTYEELLEEPELTLQRICGGWDVDLDLTRAIARLDRPTSVVASTGIRGLGGWKRDLTPAQISRVMKIVNQFGIDFYLDSGALDRDVLYGADLAERIRRAGGTTRNRT